MGISSLLKVTPALRQLPYTSAADAIDENLALSETTALQCLKRFCEAVIKIFWGVSTPAYTGRAPSILEQNARRCFVGMAGSVDCMHWQWRNCPTALAGQHKGKEKKSTKILEVVADYNLRIWHCNFGSPGSLSDINILDHSHLFDDFWQAHKYCTPFLLADAIYPEWAVFLKAIERPRGHKPKHFSASQEACRKDVERCFGMWCVDAMGIVMHACIILHNMIVADEINDPAFAGHGYLFKAEAQPGGLPDIQVQWLQYPIRTGTIADLIVNASLLHSNREHHRL
ncbi:Nuclease HARBI1 [Phytophthora megakarya]|uniref:Nuclease HARBI1 n=1 Tax=Phytophthora megakarya TaxID=4795 RepID=A0A225WDZ7_9STRA|nr:Nuclease HARBI1 [Phytophthora megakarya]